MPMPQNQIVKKTHAPYHNLSSLNPRIGLTRRKDLITISTPLNRNSYIPQTNSEVINMTYRDNGSYSRFPDSIKTTKKSNLILANKEMDVAINREKKKLLLRDDAAVKSNQNVYDSLSE